MRHSAERYRRSTIDLHTLRRQLEDVTFALSMLRTQQADLLVDAVDAGMPMSEAGVILGVSKTSAHRLYTERSRTRSIDGTIPVDEN